MSAEDTHKANDDDLTLPHVIPVFPLSKTILLPGCSLPLNIFEPRYLAMFRDAIKGDRVIGMIQPKCFSDNFDAAQKPELWTVGGAGTIGRVSETDDGRLLVELRGLSRFKATEELATLSPYRRVAVDWITESMSEDDSENEANQRTCRDALLESFKDYLTSKSLQADMDAIATAPFQTLVNTLSMIIPMAGAEKQALLEANTLEERCETLTALLAMALNNESRGVENGPN